jgi:hypothetical protein
VHQTKLSSQNGHSNRSGRVSAEHYVPNASLPDPGQISARFGRHDHQALPPARQCAGSLQMVYIHYDDARDCQIWAFYQMNLMYAIP